MESTIVFWRYIGVVEKKMETTTYGLGVCDLGFSVSRSS